MIAGEPAHLLGGHIAQGAQDNPRLCPGRCCRQRGRRKPGLDLCQLRQTEVEDLHVTLLRHEEILRLEIAMNDPARVRRRETTDDLLRIIESTPNRQPSDLFDLVAERAALQQLRHDKRPIAIVADIVDGENVGVIKRSGSERFLLESPEPIGIGGGGRGQNLIATSRRRRVSVARYTSPIPPTPIWQ